MQTFVSWRSAGFLETIKSLGSYSTEFLNSCLRLFKFLYFFKSSSSVTFKYGLILTLNNLSFFLQLILFCISILFI